MKTLSAEQVRAKAMQLVQDHAARLGMDAFAAATLVRAIHAIPVDLDPVPPTHRAKDHAGFAMDDHEEIGGTHGRAE